MDSNYNMPLWGCSGIYWGHVGTYSSIYGVSLSYKDCHHNTMRKNFMMNHPTVGPTMEYPISDQSREVYGWVMSIYVSKYYFLDKFSQH